MLKRHWTTKLYRR